MSTVSGSSRIRSCAAMRGPCGGGEAVPCLLTGTALTSCSCHTSTTTMPSSGLFACSLPLLRSSRERRTLVLRSATSPPSPLPMESGSVWAPLMPECESPCAPPCTRHDRCRPTECGERSPGGRRPPGSGSPATRSCSTVCRAPRTGRWAHRPRHRPGVRLGSSALRRTHGPGAGGRGLPPCRSRLRIPVHWGSLHTPGGQRYRAAGWTARDRSSRAPSRQWHRSASR